ncbi:hypothetical protein SAMN05443668_105101 [Cryptosporangium aurantiacum]|uniref:Uncharacterized protein n=1 Tax=Cryptosporangium aurantiacum TaxID=134849 RepID=A0A1M7QP86_9ACTN|nr:hypothetical protein SAMN05443668_105101 [Cryptosporangium aurantiacum]
MRLYRRAQAAGWSTVVLSAATGLVVAALVALTPWRVPDISGARDRVESVREDGGVERGVSVRSFIAATRDVSGADWYRTAD